MKCIQFLFTCVTVLISMSPCLADVCSSFTTIQSAAGCPSTVGKVYNNTIAHCKTTAVWCNYRGQAPSNSDYIKFNSCTSCESGYHIVATYDTNNGFCSLYMQTCAQNTTSSTDDCASCTCSECTARNDDDSYWVSAGKDGYELRYYYGCAGSSGGCFIAATSYRCAAGYYGTTSSSLTGCTKCPTISGGNAYSDPSNNDTVQKCYIFEGSDDKGHFHFGGAKCYSE